MSMLQGLAGGSHNADISASSAASDASAVDLSAIEQQKENIQPLAAGRSAKALHTLFTSDRKTLQDDLKVGHDRFNKEIEQVENDGADDPLDVYHRYVRWTLASYPSGPSHDSHLIPLLERATRRFVHEEQYRSDVRLLKLWMLYAKYVDCPKDIFRFLEGLQVGIKLASFYEEWAMLEEQGNNFPAADAIYNLGIARRAQPLERLKKRREAFQARMMLPRPTVAASETPGSSSQNAFVRPVLGKSSSSAPSFRGTALSNASARSALPNNGAAGFAVFRDGGDENGASAADVQEGWNDFGTNASKRRENERAAVPWKGETLPMSGTAPPVQIMRLEVFRDDDAEIPATKAPVQAETDGLGFKSIRAPGQAELLRKNPFRNYSEPVELGDTPDEATVPPAKATDARSSVSSKPSIAKAASKAKTAATSVAASAGSKKPEKVASPLHDIYPEGISGPEYSFEEIIAAKRGLRDARTGGLSSPFVELAQWEKEAQQLGTAWRFDASGNLVERDPHTGEALFEYQRRADEQEQEEKLRAAKERKEQKDKDRLKARKADEEKARSEMEAAAKKAAEDKARKEAERLRKKEAEEAMTLQEEAEEALRLQKEAEAEQERLRMAELRRQARLQEEEEEEARRQRQRQLLEEAAAREREEQLKHQQALVERQRLEREAELRRQREQLEEEERIRREEEEEREVMFGSGRADSQHRPPSPTINTKAALAEVNAMFSKTMRFDDDQQEDDGSETEQSEEDSFEQEPVQETPLLPSQAETDASFWSQAQSQSQQPFDSQQSVPSQGSSSEADSEAGETTEESESEDDYGQQVNQRYLAPAQHQSSMSRSSSSSSSSSSGFGLAADEPLSHPPKSAKPPFMPRQHQSSIIGDENASSSRPAFKPTRTPLGAKGLSASAKRDPQPAFQVFQEPSSDDSERAPPAGAQRIAIFADQDVDHAIQSEHMPHAVLETPGYAMGRRINGNNRFASMMDVMTPITERTLEFGMATVTMTETNMMGEVAVQPAYAHSEGEEDFEHHQVEDLASSRGSNWDVGKRQLELIEEEEERSMRADHSSQNVSETSTVVPPNEVSFQASGLTGSAPATPPQALPPCDPLDGEIVRDLLDHCSRPLVSIPGFCDRRHQVANKLDGLQRVAKGRRKSGNGRSSAVHEEAAWEVMLHKDVFSVREKLGEGGYGAVFRVAESLEESGDVDEEEDTTQTALKVQKPANVWEFFILDRLQARLPERTRLSTVRAHRLYAYEDESHLLLDYCDQGTLLDAVNHAQEAGAGPAGTSAKGFEEVLAVFFTIELLRILEAFHASGFLHGDFKVDNCLLRLDDVPGGARGWTSGYKRDGSGGWSCKGVKVIDFGRTVDLTAFPAGQTFSTNWRTDMHDCAEMREGRPWTYQPDYYGLACIAHVLLFGKYLETVSATDQTTGEVRYSLKEQLKRYHQIPLWTKFFDTLLNPCLVRNDGSLPLTAELSDLRNEMESWLEANSDKGGKNLKGLLKKLEIQALSRHSK